jgi:nucleoside-diphosphate-sugar epimerase
MNIVWFTWKDIKNPQAGGAEQISSEMAKRLVSDGHKVTILTSTFPGASRKEKIDGYTYQAMCEVIGTKREVSIRRQNLRAK